MEENSKQSPWVEFFNLYSKAVEVGGIVVVTIGAFLWLFAGLPGILAGLLGGIGIGVFLVGMTAKLYASNSDPMTTIGEHMQGYIPTRPTKLVATTQAEDKGKAEELTRRVAELEREKATLEEEATKKIGRLQKQAETKDVQISSRDNEINALKTKYEWLDTIVEYQRSGLQKYVLVEICTINASLLAEGKRYIEFTFYVVNYSMFYVSIPMAEGTEIKVSIHFKGDMLSGVAKLVENKVVNCQPYGTGSLKIRQWVNQDEAKDILETLEKIGNLFDFSNAIVTIGGGDKYQEVEVVRLDLTRGMQNADLENKIIQLEAKLVEEKALQESLKTQHEDELLAQKQRANIIRSLNYARGAALIIKRQLEEDEAVSKDTLQFLVIMVKDAVGHNFPDTPLSDFFGDKLDKIPSEPFAQRFWVSGLFEILSKLMELKGG